jgi:hypothetical protein
VDDSVSRLVVSPGFDATLLHSQDPNKTLENRTWMKAILARYGRIDPHSWEHRDLGEMRAYFEVVVEMVKREGSPAEDR